MISSNIAKGEGRRAKGEGQRAQSSELQPTLKLRLAKQGSGQRILMNIFLFSEFDYHVIDQTSCKESQQSSIKCAPVPD